MPNFKLDCDRILQGNFSLGDLNLLFIFQVNCPGCFLYGFPQMERIHQEYKSQGLTVLGLATAFEDFEFNTATNVELLLSEQKTIGATKQAIGDLYPQEISFPIASDRLTSGTEINTPENIEFLRQHIADDEAMSIDRQSNLQQKVAGDLACISHTSATFALNLLPGTPSFILCDHDLQILDRWFGHISDRQVLEKIVRARSRQALAAASLTKTQVTIKS
jgi:hypothetical protein